jgi:phosphate transport system substrate-binding protein
MKKSLSFIVILVIMLSAWGVWSTPTSAHGDTPTSTPTPPNLDLIRQDYPRVDGSTSTLPLQVVIACTLYDVPFHWEIGQSLVARIAPNYDYVGDEDTLEFINHLQHTNTNNAYLNLIDKRVDLILVARLPSESELAAAEKQGVVLDARPVALDAFVFLLNMENPIDELTLDAIRSIYSGEVTHWADLGLEEFPDGAIEPYQRDPDSGSQELMRMFVMGDLPIIDAPDMVISTMAGIMNAIGIEPLSIGYSVYFYAVNIFPDPNVKLAAIDGVAPNSDTIAARTYPLVSEVYVVTRADQPPDSTAALLRDWLPTAHGQTTVAASGYVPLQKSE